MKVYVPTPSCPPQSKVPSQAQGVLSRLFLVTAVGAASGSPTGHVAGRIDAALGRVSDALGGVADGVSQAFGGIAENVAKSADWKNLQYYMEGGKENVSRGDGNLPAPPAVSVTPFAAPPTVSVVLLRKPLPWPSDMMDG